MAPKLEDRVANLEQELAQLKAQIVSGKEHPHPWVDRLKGAFKGNKKFLQAMELGRQYRESLRPKPGKKKAKKPS